MENGRVRAAVQERRRLVREGIAMFLEGDDDIKIVGTAATADDLLALCRTEQLDVAVLEADVWDWDPCWLARELRIRQPAVRIVGLYSLLHVEHLQRVKQAGVAAFVDRHEGIEPVLGAIRRSTDAVVTPLPRRHEPSWEGSSLTVRECEVLELIGSGSTSLETSMSLGISVKTVENHKQRIFGKLGVQNQAHAVAVAMREGLLHGEVGSGLRRVT